MSLKVIPQAVDHLSVNEVQNPLEFEKRKGTKDASKTSLYEI